MNERLIPMIKRLFRDLGSRQRPGVRRASGAFERLTARGKLQRAGALQNALALMMIASVVIAVRPVQAQWEPLPPLPEPNGGFISGHQDGKLVIVGGTNWEGGKKNWLKAVRVFAPETGQWGEIAFGYPVAYGVGAQSGGSSFRFIGGSDGKEPFKAIGHVAADRASFLKAPRLPPSVVLASGGEVKGSLILVGGSDDAGNLAGVTSSTFLITSSTSKRLADYPGKPFATAASAVAGNELFVFGGMNYDAEAKLPANSSEAYAFSPTRNVWRKLKPLAVPTRGLTAVTLDEGHIYIAGGYREDFTAEAVIYDVKADSYRKALPLPYAAMVGLVKMGDHVYCLGGEDKKQSRTDKFFRIPVAELLK